MRCFHPIGLQEKPRHVFDFKHIIGNAGAFTYVPCGGCIACRINYASAWAGRLFIEDLQSVKSYFLTLTYNENSIIYVDGYPTLIKKDIRNFIKKLRRKISVRYFCAGEYGYETGRAHYHLILFFKKKYNYNSLYHTISNTWDKGFITLENVIPKHYFYVTKYLVKRLTGTWRFIFQKETGCEPEFSLMSLKPYIGYIEDKSKLEAVVKDGYIFNGKKRFYLHKIYNDKLEVINPELYNELSWEKQYKAYATNKYETYEQRKSEKDRIIRNENFRNSIIR